ncbi:hypothetical protein DFJ74DRAFT_680909 [Hyaloraphidium curvatum]|nr:hypothetical protein DFJ74DRAFT_680909 [Hyaloraphidium curvatum]
MSAAAGFTGAPAVKSLLLLCVTSSVAAGAFGGRHLLHLSAWPHLLRDLQLWRLVTSQVAFRSAPEVLWGGLLVYNQGRVAERTGSSARFCSFAAVVTALTCALELSFLLAARPAAGVAPGPYGVALGALVLYLAEVPATYRVRIGGVGVGDKWFPCVVGVQLALSNYPASLYSSACGLAAGLAYKFLLPEAVTKWRFPPRLRAWASSSLLPLLDSSRVPRGTAPSHASAEPPAQPASARPPPDPQQVGFLVAMGFGRDAAVAALREAENDPNAAAELLLSRAAQQGGS